EWLADIAGGVGERLHHPLRRLVAQVADAPRGLAQHGVLAPLQSLMAARPLLFARERSLKTCELFVAVLDGRLGRASADENSFLSVSRSDERVHAQVDADYRLLRAWRVWRLTDQAHDAIGQADLDRSPWYGDGVRKPDTQRSALAVGQNQPAVADAGI